MSSTENETKTSIPRDFVFESWEDETLNLKPQLLRGLYAFGFDTPSPIQKKAVGPRIPRMVKENVRISLHKRNRAQVKQEHFQWGFLKL